MRLVLNGSKMSRPQHLSTRILKVYTEALTGFRHIHQPDGLNTTLLAKALSLRQLLRVGRLGECTFQVQRKG